jgi:hypothetical protein
MTKSTAFTVKDPVYTHLFPEPFTVLDERVDELPIRKPTGMDMIEVGSPVAFDSNTGKAELDIPKCYAMTARLSGMPERALLGIDVGEMQDLFWLVASFFMKGRQTLLPAIEKRKAASLEQPGSPEPSPDGSTPDSP